MLTESASGHSEQEMAHPTQPAPIRLVGLYSSMLVIILFIILNLLYAYVYLSCSPISCTGYGSFSFYLFIFDFPLFLTTILATYVFMMNFVRMGASGRGLVTIGMGVGVAIWYVQHWDSSREPAPWLIYLALHCTVPVAAFVGIYYWQATSYAKHYGYTVLADTGCLFFITLLVGLFLVSMFLQIRILMLSVPLLSLLITWYAYRKTGTDG
jgi:hypothetical protein